MLYHYCMARICIHIHQSSRYRLDEDSLSVGLQVVQCQVVICQVCLVYPLLLGTPHAPQSTSTSSRLVTRFLSVPSTSSSSYAALAIRAAMAARGHPRRSSIAVPFGAFALCKEACLFLLRSVEGT